MRRFLVMLVLASATLAPSAARAGLVLGARLGAGIPGGDIGDGDKLADFVDWTVPIQLDVGGRIGEQLTIGGYLRLAPGKLDSAIADGCDAANADCSVLDLGLGAQVDFRLAPGKAGPWLGGYAGWELLRYDYAQAPIKYAISASGWEIGAQGGIDFAWGVLTMGPYGSIGIGQFGKAKEELNGISATRDINDKGVHTWIQVGLRGGFAF